MKSYLKSTAKIFFLFTKNSIHDILMPYLHLITDNVNFVTSISMETSANLQSLIIPLNQDQVDAF